MYPNCGVGGSANNIKGARTFAGSVCQIPVASEGTTTLYLKAVDWLSDLGDLKGLIMTTRGGDATVGATMTIEGKRLYRVKVGDANPQDVQFNASSLNIRGNCIEVVDVRNVTSLRNPVSLLDCPRLKEAYFDGSSTPNIQLPIGSKLTHVSFPPQLATLFLHSLPLLQEENMIIPDSSFTTITGYYFNNCPGINPISLLRRIIDTPNNILRYVTIISREPVICTTLDVDLLASLAEGYGRIVYNSENNVVSNSNDLPNLQMTLNVDSGVNEDSVIAIRNAFPGLTIISKGNYIKFEDVEVARICATNWGDYVETTTTEVVSDDSDIVEQTIVTTLVSMLNTTSKSIASETIVSTRAKEEADTAGTTSTTTKTPVGIIPEQAAAVTSLGTAFMGNTTITAFNELSYFTGLTGLVNAFRGCENLLYTIVPKAPLTSMYYTFYGCKKIRSINIPTDQNWVFIQEGGEHIFYDCNSLEGEIDLSSIKRQALSNLAMGATFGYCKKITKITLPKANGSLDSCFIGCSNLETIVTDNFTIYYAGGSFRFRNIIGANNANTICGKLKNITSGFRGLGVTFALDLAYAPLTHESALQIIDGLRNVTDTTYLTFSAVTMATLTEDEIAVATSKGWAVATRG